MMNSLNYHKSEKPEYLIITLMYLLIITYMTVFFKISTDLNDKKLAYHGSINKLSNTIFGSSSYLAQKCAYHSQNFSVEFYFENIISLEDWSKKHFKIWKCYTTYLLQINWIMNSAIRYTVLPRLHKKYCTFLYCLQMWRRSKLYRIPNYLKVILWNANFINIRTKCTVKQPFW